MKPFVLGDPAREPDPAFLGRSLRVLESYDLRVNYYFDERGRPICPCCWESMFETEPGRWTCHVQQRFAAFVDDVMARIFEPVDRLHVAEPPHIILDTLAQAAIRAAGNTPTTWEHP
jgi:hypothetical protein